MPAAAEVTCPHCGTRNPVGSNFCNRCGTALGAESAPPRDPAAPMAPAEAVDAGLGDEGRPPVEPSPLPPLEADEVDATARDERGVEAADDPTLDALLSAYQPPQPDLPPAPPEPVRFPDENLLGGGLGYLDLVSVSGEMPPPRDEDPPLPGADSEHWRTLRTLLREEPVLATAGGGSTIRQNYRPIWAALLLVGAALMGILFSSTFWPGSPQTLDGARAAHAAINALEVDDDVLVIWMADPSTTAELNLVALPVVSNLLEREARSIVVGTRPTSLGSARRLYADAVRGLDESAMRSVVDNWVGGGVFVPGGEAALAMVAGNPSSALLFVPARPPQPRLVLVVAANPNDAQEWLEIGWPRLRVPTVAVTPATGDPLLRPYLQSGQLDGLVAGFDGASSYQALRNNALGAAATLKLQRVTNAQNWGALALLLALIAGNLFPLFGRSRRV
jgi:hypothetical protein